MNSKRIFIIIEFVLASMVIVMAFIMTREQSGKDRRRISVIIPDPDASRWSAFRYGLKMAAEDQGVEVFVVSTGDVLTLEDEIYMIGNESGNGVDAVILQPVPGEDVLRKLEEASKKIPIMLVGDPASEDGEKCRLPVTCSDDYHMGKALAEEVLRDFNGNVEGKALGIVAENEESVEALRRKKGFEDALLDRGARISWTVCVSCEETDHNYLENQSKTDLVIALDDVSLTRAGECAAAKDLHGALVYGIGNSTEAVYYLDTGMAECLLVPDEFNRGYQSLTEAAKNLGLFSCNMKGRVLPFNVLRRKELFTKKNQEILLTMSQ